MQGKALQYHPITSSYTMLRKWQWVFQRLNDYSDFFPGNKQTFSSLRPVRLSAATSAWRHLHADAEHQPRVLQPLPQRHQQDPRQARHQVDPAHRWGFSIVSFHTSRKEGEIVGLKFWIWSTGFPHSQLSLWSDQIKLEIWCKDLDLHIFKTEYFTSQLFL